MQQDPDTKYEDFFKMVVGRPESELLNNNDLQLIFGKSRILIVGAGGSIGSAIAKRLTKAEISEVFFLDRDESGLHALALELSDNSASQSDNYFVADIRDRQGLGNVLETIKPQVVIHAAALKHLTVLEKFPREGFLTNIMGTLNVAELCLELGVQSFINISTDKAANPVSILGKTKKIAELISEEVFIGSSLKQCSVRFGNVFASRGSVIETFIHQLKNDIPVTITDPEVSRFFMSQNEAANLVLAASSLPESGIYIQNMGQQVKIIDIVNRIGNFLGVKPRIKIIGLQRGEKLHEELFDGPFSSTKFNEISRSEYTLKTGLLLEAKLNQPINNSESVQIIDSLVLKYRSK
jgi:dTDP-glucose 4,6-dehydratase